MAAACVVAEPARLARTFAQPHVRENGRLRQSRRAGIARGRQFGADRGARKLCLERSGSASRRSADRSLRERLLTISRRPQEAPKAVTGCVLNPPATAICPHARDSAGETQPPKSCPYAQSSSNAGGVKDRFYSFITIVAEVNSTYFIVVAL